MLKHFQLNEVGRDFVVGDLHGCFATLEVALNGIGFNPAIDRLFSVGDLVDRGEESERALEWLAKPWFHAVRGNHEQMAIDHCAGNSDARLYAMNGGMWMLSLPADEAAKYADAFTELPIALDVETDKGLVGIVHADCPVSNWAEMEPMLDADPGFAQACIWSRDRATNKFTGHIDGVDQVIVGHTPMTEPIYLGNVHYIDTGAVFGRKLTLIQIQ